MKIKYLTNVFLCLVILLSTNTYAHAQKKLKEGKIVFELVEVDTKIAELELLKGSEISFEFNKEKQIFDFGLLYGLVRFQIYYEHFQDSLSTLYDFMGEKYLVKSPTNTFVDTPKFLKIDYYKKQIKTISGYPAHQVILHEGDIKTEIWVTNKISTFHPTFEKLFPGLEDFPLEFIINGEKANLRYVATLITEELNENCFEINKEYQSISQEEFKEKMGGMEFGF